MSSKRSKTIQLLAMGAAPFVLTACNDGKEVKTVKKDERFVNIQDCMKAGKPDYLCADSYLAALNRHKEIAPQYEKIEDCESDFMEKYCTKNDQGKYVPKMAGFSLITEQKVVNAPNSQPATNSGQQVAQSEQPATSGSSSGGQTVIHQDSGSGDFLTGVLLGNLMSNNNSGPSHYSEPVYRRRDDRGSGYSTNTLSGYANSGVKPSKSIQEKVNAYSNSDSSKDYRSTRTNSYSSKPSSSYSGSSYSSSSYSKPSTISVSKSTSRGGFGSISSSRGGWGG